MFKIVFFIKLSFINLFYRTKVNLFILDKQKITIYFLYKKYI